MSVTYGALGLQHGAEPPCFKSKLPPSRAKKLNISDAREGGELHLEARGFSPVSAFAFLPSPLSCFYHRHKHLRNLLCFPNIASAVSDGVAMDHYITQSPARGCHHA